MKNIIKAIFVLICVISPLIFAQNRKKQLKALIRNYNSAKLIKGVPASLEKIRYFKPKYQISYAVIYAGRRDSIYFISNSSRPNTNKYSLVLTSEGRLKSYDYLKINKAGGNELFATGSVKIPNDKTFNIKLYYFPEKKTIYDKIIQKNSFNTKISDLANKYDLSFELGMGFKYMMMFGRTFNTYKKKWQSTYYGSLLAFQLAAGFRILNSYKIDFKFGVEEVNENFWGYQDGIIIEGKIFNPGIYAEAGIDFFHDYGAGHNSVNSGGDFKFYCLGLGFNGAGDFSFDILYWIPNNKVLGVTIDNDRYPTRYYNIINKGLLEFGLYYWFIN